MLYRVKVGCTFGHSDQHGPGAVVELSAHEAAPFLDKLEPVAAVEADEAQGDGAAGDGAGEPSAPRTRRGKGA